MEKIKITLEDLETNKKCSGEFDIDTIKELTEYHDIKISEEIKTIATEILLSLLSKLKKIEE